MKTWHLFIISHMKIRPHLINWHVSSAGILISVTTINSDAYNDPYFHNEPKEFTASHSNYPIS